MEPISTLHRAVGEVWPNSKNPVALGFTPSPGRSKLLPELAEESDTGTTRLRFDKTLQQARALAGKSHVDLQTHVLAGHPAHKVIKLATDLSADLIVVGASGHSALYDRMIGSRAQKILHHANCPVLVVK
jgi:nucleotide-binding universal stress UspA family protein